LWTLLMFEAFLRNVVDAPHSTGLPVPTEAALA
jgi:asparagine synthase (glutamine-hydrolysing)